MIKSDAVKVQSNLLDDEEICDQELIDRVLDGDSSSYALILKRYQDGVYRMLLRQTGNSYVAADLAQETFIKVYEKLATFRAESALSTWITRIALNLSNNYFSSKEYRASLKSTNTFTVERSAETDAHNVEKKLTLLREFITELKPKYRSVVLLCSLEKKSYEEAAIILKIPVGTVRSRLHEARLTLRNRFLMEASDI